MSTEVEAPTPKRYDTSALWLLPLRWVTAWMFLSAFHRRVVLDLPRMSPDASNYVGLKFNQFLPGAVLGVGSLLEWLVQRPAALHVFLIVFTIIEGLVGLALMFGLFTRLAALGVVLLSGGILMGSGWLGPTCLDEWQIGSLGVAAGATLMLVGAGPLSLDALVARRAPWLTSQRWWRLCASEPLAIAKPGRAAVLWGAAALGLTLWTNQVFYGGVFGTLHNDSVRPHLTLSEATLAADGRASLTVYRDKGPETYGAFIVAISVRRADGREVFHHDAASLSALDVSAIVNRYLLEVRTGPHGLLIPLGSRAAITLAPPPEISLEPGEYEIILEDVSGATFGVHAVVPASAASTQDQT